MDRLLVFTALSFLWWVDSAVAAPKSTVAQVRGSGELREIQHLPDASFGLEVDWSIEVGSGYSQVWIEDDTVVTMYASAGMDLVSAVDAATGEVRWTHELAATYRGHDGSDDGPLSTPVVADGDVYAVGPAGQIVALDLASGVERWQRSLDEHNSSVPHWGYTASPVVFDDLLLVATGGEGHTVTAFDRATGATRWSTGDDPVSYQTPMLMELGGRPQLVVAANFHLMGVDPRSGEILWKLRHAEGSEPDEIAHPTAVDSTRFLVKYQDSSRLYRWSDTGVEEIWRSRAFGNTFALPVRVEDHFYGFTGGILSCVEVETGEITWRSRQPGGAGLSEFGGKLAIVSNSGELVVVSASAAGYQELARKEVLTSSDFSIPSYSDGRFFVRNMSRLAGVRVTASPSQRSLHETEADRLRGTFGGWVASLEAAAEGDRQALVDSRFETIDRTPILEQGGLVHFVWRGAAEDVGLQGTFVPDGEIGLFSVAGTDLFYRTFELNPKAQYNYTFVVDFGDPTLDPSNPFRMDHGLRSVSDLRMHEWPPSPHIEAPAAGAARGRLDRFQFHSEILANVREISVWRPSDFADDREGRYPVVVFNHGDRYLEAGLMQNTLDNLVGHTVAPVIAVFVPRVALPEYGGEAADDYNRFLVEELLPHLDRHYRTDREHRSIIGVGSGGVAAIYAALSYPSVFRQVAAQSFYGIEPTYEKIPQLIASEGQLPSLVYIAWSHQDIDLGGLVKAEEKSIELLERLRERGFTVNEQVVDYSPDWAGWRTQDDDILETLHPLRVPR